LQGAEIGASDARTAWTRRPRPTATLGELPLAPRTALPDRCDIFGPKYGLSTVRDVSLTALSAPEPSQPLTASSDVPKSKTQSSEIPPAAGSVPQAQDDRPPERLHAATRSTLNAGRALHPKNAHANGVSAACALSVFVNTESYCNESTTNHDKTNPPSGAPNGQNTENHSAPTQKRRRQKTGKPHRT